MYNRFHGFLEEVEVIYYCYKCVYIITIDIYILLLQGCSLIACSSFSKFPASSPVGSLFSHFRRLFSPFFLFSVIILFIVFSYFICYFVWQAFNVRNLFSFICFFRFLPRILTKIVQSPGNKKLFERIL